LNACGVLILSRTGVIGVIATGKRMIMLAVGQGGYGEESMRYRSLSDSVRYH
tara:strand:+ start:365 stop:520 length:156 start_codon:yes stop_codon:yes gene_type:complete